MRRDVGTMTDAMVDDYPFIRAIHSIADAKNLHELVVVSMRQIPVAGFDCFRNHPTLREASIGLGSLRRNAEVTRLLGLPPVSNTKPIKKYVEDDDTAND